MKPVLYAGAAAAAAVAALAAPALAQSRDQIRIVGSSTVFPYTQAVAEQFAGMTGLDGAGGRSRPAPAAACRSSAAASAPDFPDITGASRAMTESEYEACVANGVDNITEVLLGYDGLSIAHSIDGPDLDLTKAQLFQALASEVEVDGQIVAEPLQELERDRPGAARRADPGLRPAADLRHPRRLRRARHARGLRDLPRDRGARRATARTRSASACARTARSSRPARTTTSSSSASRPTPNALGIFGYSFLFENSDRLKAVADRRRRPDAETIASGEYAVSRPLFIYVKNAHRGVIPGLDEFLAEYVSEESFGPDGYLPERGLIPLSDAEREQVRAAVAEGAAMDRFN